jgi:hypothetical protein
MSRAGVSPALIALVAVASLAALVSCTGGDEEALLDAVAPSVDSVRVNFSCGTVDSIAVDSIALATPSGIPAWSVRRKPNNPITWVVPANVTINSILGKTPVDTLPLDPDGPQGGAAGTPFKSKIKAHAASKTYHYLIDATCQPASGPARRLVIDPEMIIP